MNLNDIRAHYDAEQRIDAPIVGMRRARGDHTVRLIANSIGRGVVIHSDLTPDNADDAIAAELDFFRGEPGITHLEWKLFDYDAPLDLNERLEAHGFTVGEPEAICVLDLAHLPDRLRQQPTHDIRRITDPTGIADVIAVKTDVYPDDAAVGADGWFAVMLADNLRVAPEMIRLYVAYVDGIPVSTAWMDIIPGSAFAGLWGGSTRAAYRGRGIYTDLIAVRAAAAIAAGARYLTIDASPMSRPIVEKHGFQFMAWTWACETAL